MGAIETNQKNIIFKKGEEKEKKDCSPQADVFHALGI